MAVAPEAINLPDRFLPQLLSFLEGLRVSGYRIGTGEFIKVRTLFSLMLRRGILPADLRRLKTHIGAIVCSTAAEQRDFETRFHDWFHRFESPPETEEQEVAEPTAPEVPAVAKFRRQRRQNRILLVVALLVSLGLAIYYLGGWMGSPFTAQPPPATGKTDTQSEAGPAVQVPGANGSMKIWAPVLILAPFLLWLIIRAWRWRRFLARQTFRGAIEIRRLFVEKPKARRFFAPDLIRRLRSLRAHVAVESDEIDPSATVVASTEMGGFYTPIMGVRRLSPEYLLLIDRKTRSDHQARLFDALTDCLKEADIYFHRYYFDADPRSCLGGDGDPTGPVSLRKLAARYQHHRLILLTDGAGLIEPLSDRAWHWCSQFHPWDQRIILTPTSREGWGPWEDSLRRNGFQLLPADDQGLRRLATLFLPDKISQEDDHTPAEPLPESLVAEPDLWHDSMPPDPEVLHEMLSDLRWYLRPAGYLWLCACAVYPKLDWHLTLFLGHNLTDAEGSDLFSRTTLAALAQLPWFRQGSLPDWLREILIGDLPKETESRTRRLLHDLLISSLERPLESFDLAYAVKKRDRDFRYARKIWSAMRRRSEKSSPVHDQIFVTFMENPLAVSIPRALHRAFAAPGYVLDLLHRLRGRLLARPPLQLPKVRPKPRPRTPAADGTIWKQATGFGSGLAAIFAFGYWGGGSNISATGWVYLLLGLYIIYCFLQGEWQARRIVTSADFMLGRGATPMVTMALAGTAICFSGWSTIGHPGLVWRDGLPYGFAAFMAITVALTGTLFGKRLWLLSRRYGFVTPSEMFVYYYQNPSIRWLANLTSLLYAVFYAAVQLMAAAALFHLIGGVPVNSGAIFLTFLLWIYTCRGGYPAVLRIGSVQMLLTWGAIFVLGYVALVVIGPWREFMDAANQLTAQYLEVPRIVNFGLGAARGETAWTSTMILTYLFALMGVQASPAFTMYFFSMKSPRSLTWQQLFCSAILMGAALFFFTNFQGLGAKIMELRGDVTFASLNSSNVVPTLMQYLLAPSSLGLIFIGHICATQSTAAAHVVSGSSMLVRDFYWRGFRNRAAGEREQIWITRLAITVTLILSLTVGITSNRLMIILGALATSFGLLMYIPLLGVVWGFRISGRGVIRGMLAGMLATFLTYYVWKYPLSMHCAFWGLSTGFIVTWLVSKFGRRESLTAHQAEVRLWLESMDIPSKSAGRWRAGMKWIVPAWFFFAVGPGCILGNRAFSVLGLPPLWSWQVAWWLVGVLMIYAICIKAEMTTWSGDPEEIATVDPDRMEKIFVKEA